MAVEAPKEYTKEEIANFSIEKLEKLAAKLKWPGPKSSWGGYSGVNHQAYRTTGFPKTVGQKTINSRKEYLVTRLQTTKQSKWNPAAKVLEEQRKAEAARKEALLPKVKINAKTLIEVSLKDRRPGGYTFILTKSDDGKKILARQDRNKEGSVGRKLCSATAEFSPAAFESTIRAISSIKLPEDMNLPSEVQISTMLRAINGYTISFQSKGDVVYIWEDGSLCADASKWHFNIKDLFEVIDALNTKYTFTAVKEKK